MTQTDLHLNEFDIFYFRTSSQLFKCYFKMFGWIRQVSFFCIALTKPMKKAQLRMNSVVLDTLGGFLFVVWNTAFNDDDFTCLHVITKTLLMTKNIGKTSVKQ